MAGILKHSAVSIQQSTFSIQPKQLIAKDVKDAKEIPALLLVELEIRGRGFAQKLHLPPIFTDDSDQINSSRLDLLTDFDFLPVFISGENRACARK